ncbi:MAG: bacteriohemerythrin [Candidatus Competibacteraceae bacterium]|jgi:hemerythrin|nr:bacteriohemerythrin [Candidatus Competibacteraceae bacterium]
MSVDTTNHDGAALDAEHQVQTSLIMALCQAIEAQRPSSEVDEILDRLTSYTDAHFMAEQLLMRLKAYPHYDAHQQEHDRLIGKVRELEQRYRAGEVQLTLETANSLKSLLLSHTQGADSALAEHLEKQS